jgi:hypothetical protein
VCVLCAAFVQGVPGAQACALDGVPSLWANGYGAVLNTNLPQTATFMTWAPFVIPHSFAARQAIRLHEDLAKVAPVLGPARLHSRWRWAFADGQVAMGISLATVIHRYARPGHYHLIVATYNARFKVWLPFDSVELVVRS